MYPIVAVAWLLLAVVVTVHIGIKPYYLGQRRIALFKWAVPMSLVTGVVLALFAVVAGLSQKYSFGF
jgi:hypothetical protein